jgi:hypothetical protein
LYLKYSLKGRGGEIPPPPVVFVRVASKGVAGKDFVRVGNTDVKDARFEGVKEEFVRVANTRVILTAFAGREKECGGSNGD